MVEIIQILNKIKDPEQIIIVPVSFGFPFKEGSEESAILVMDDEFQTYIYPVPEKIKDLDLITWLMIQNNILVQNMLMKAYLGKKTACILPDTMLEWLEYEELFKHQLFYKPIKPAAKVEIEWKKS